LSASEIRDCAAKLAPDFISLNSGYSPDSSTIRDKVEQSARDQIERLVAIYTGDLFDGEVIEQSIGNEADVRSTATRRGVAKICLLVNAQ
jgi:hypothetical protein